MDELRFKIDAFQPDTIPMARLAEYMAELAALLGNKDSVHFVRLDAGSVEMVHRVDPVDRPKVEARLGALRAGDGATDAVRAFRCLDDMLANDNAVGTLADAGAVLIDFPGRTRPKPVDYGAFNEQGSLDGVLVKIGGLADIVPVHLQEVGEAGQVHICQARRDLVREMAPHIFGGPLRVQGTGRWRREPNGAWKMAHFTIAAFEVLDDAPLVDVVKRLRDVPGSGWRAVEHPLTTLADLRGKDERLH
ncbi:hypothetical protein FBZ87_104633 [Nitrospirillum amazonense]|uniref:Uncharacterized protein n=1 Tax=Nitrospirillum amazonense TaxID=28077 RepID=A0A560JWQ0_9PROT|nr:hypothetical protein [Nitrospirillum amazonense]TWB75525.1 hypothetical protein FBZ87_104633 [Nitrospirillum amazonense]